MLSKVATLLRGKVPGQLIVQFTDRCNARCPQCNMRASKSFSRSKLEVDCVKKIIDSAAKKGISAISFTGGEPLLFFQEIVLLLKYAKEAGIKYTRTGTNGFMFIDSGRKDYLSYIERIAEALAETGIYSFWISIDSSEPAIHESMRGLPGVIQGIEKALPVFRRYGIYPSANLGINRNIVNSDHVNIFDSSQFYSEFREGFRKFYRFVINLGFTIANVCYPMSMNYNLHAVYGAISDAHLMKFNSEEKSLVFQALFEIMSEFRSKIRIFTPKCALYSLIRQYTSGDEHCYPCRGGKDFFFIDAKNADTFPCGYRGNENFGKFWELDYNKIRQTEFCKKCDWECFRDPSELFGPLLSLLTKPTTFFRKIRQDKFYMSLWYQDLKYFSACNFFNGRIPPNYETLSRF